jgi:tRNA(adenine34) deaminase
MSDEDYMDLALREAQEAFACGDWPVGSVVVRDGLVLATGRNRQNTERDVTWHAEFDAMRHATRAHGAEQLAGATVDSTMEPCPMCAAPSRRLPGRSGNDGPPCWSARR